jgi:hypothetical protein
MSVIWFPSGSVSTATSATLIGMSRRLMLKQDI